MTMSDCSRQVSWICNIFLELGIRLGPIPVYGDNQGSIFIGSNPVQEIRTKHIDLKYHYVRECIAKGKIKVFFPVRTTLPISSPKILDVSSLRSSVANLDLSSSKTPLRATRLMSLHATRCAAHGGVLNE